MNNHQLDLAIAALLIWCQHLLRSGDLSIQQEIQLQKLLRDIEQAKK